VTETVNPKPARRHRAGRLPGRQDWSSWPLPLSYGNKQFPGTVSCVYHGWTFDVETGDLKAVITDGPASPICGKVTQPTLPRQPVGLTLTLRQPSMLTLMSVPPATSQIQVQGLEKSYKDLRVLRGVDFEVARGSIFALLGSNGAGKTTVVKILSTLLRADAGTARVNGFDVATQAADVRESISLTGQFAAVDEILSGRENLVLVARLRHLTDPGAVADDLLKRFSLTEAAARRVATYSGGMRRRLDIAMSLIGNPPVIFLDEPTAGLDPQARIEVWQAVRELAEGGTTVLLTTQYLDEAEQLADRIAILHEGRIIVNGTLSELKALLPPAKVEYVEKQPTLEDVFFALVGADGREQR
jgi:ABC-2 type transport system ATP-binding protein